MALIKVNALEKIYHDEAVLTPVLRGVSFEIKEGEFNAYLSESGEYLSSAYPIQAQGGFQKGGGYKQNPQTQTEIVKMNCI